MTAPPDPPSLAPAGSSTALATARLLISGLVEGGLRHLSLAPGSRSTPMVVAAAERGLRLWVHHDERVASFFAQGLARSLGEPVAVLCTSGTAAANFLPAVVEAGLSGAPLLVLTADRPPEQREVRAAQTIDQVNIFGTAVRWAVDVPILELGADASRYYAALARRSLAVAREDGGGPVHWNLPFREPLLDAGAFSESYEAPPQSSLISSDRRRLGTGTDQRLAEDLSGVERGLLVATGREIDADSVVELAAALGWPILADPLSGLRHGAHDRSHVVDTYDALLRSEGFLADHRPEVIIELGTPAASKPLAGFLARHGLGSDNNGASTGRARRIVVSDVDWPDPEHRASTVLRASASEFCSDLAASLAHHSETRTDSKQARFGPWLDAWMTASRIVRQGLDQAVDSSADLSEPSALRELVLSAPNHWTLMVGNSMPIRDIDTFVGASAGQIRILANRGANGIDGVMSSALGIAAASDDPVAVVVGDLSFLHDLGALGSAHRLGVSLLVVVLDNDGGGIFSHLPQKALGDEFEKFFGTPHGLDLVEVARPFAASVVRASTKDELGAALQSAHQHAGLRVVIVSVDRDSAPAGRAGFLKAGLAALTKGGDGAGETE